MEKTPLDTKTTSAYASSMRRADTAEAVHSTTKTLRLTRHLDQQAENWCKTGKFSGDEDKSGVSPPAAWGRSKAPPDGLLASSGFFDLPVGLDDEEDDLFLDSDVRRATSALLASARASATTSRAPSATTRWPESPPTPERGAEGDEGPAVTAEITAHFERSAQQVAAQIAANPLMRLPPTLPSVDAHIPREELKYSNLTGALRREQGRDGLKRAKRRAAADDDSMDLADSHGGFSVGEIRAVVNFIDNLGVMHAHAGGGDGAIDAKELNDAFRRARRVRASVEFLSEAKEVVAKLEMLIKLHGLTPEEWFTRMDLASSNPTNGSGGEKISNGRVSASELEAGLAAMCAGKAFRKYEFSAKELRVLNKFLDPNGDRSVDMSELTDALRRANLGDELFYKESEASAVMARLEQFMVEHHMRIQDLFVRLDADGDGIITMTELRRGLVQLAAPSASTRARLKRERQMAEAAAAAQTLREKLNKELVERMKKARASGALAVLARVEKHMRSNNVRVKDLFTKSGFDASGDGMLDEDEFFLALEHLGVRMNRAESALLIEFLDDSGDGQIEAYELEAALRRMKKDNKSIEDLRRRAGERHMSVREGSLELDARDSRPESISGSRLDTSPQSPKLPAITTAMVMAKRLAEKQRAKKVAKKVLAKKVARHYVGTSTAWLESFDKSTEGYLARAFSRI